MLDPVSMREFQYMPYTRQHAFHYGTCRHLPGQPRP